MDNLAYEYRLEETIVEHLVAYGSELGGLGAEDIRQADQVTTDNEDVIDTVVACPSSIPSLTTNETFNDGTGFFECDLFISVRTNLTDDPDGTVLRDKVEAIRNLMYRQETGKEINERVALGANDQYIYFIGVKATQKSPAGERMRHVTDQYKVVLLSATNP